MQHPIQIESAGGEYMDTVVVLEWAVPLGGAVKAGDIIVTVETAKAATEIEAPADGYLIEICFEPGQEAPVGAVLGKVGESPDAAAPKEAAPGATTDGNSAAAPATAAASPMPAHETDAAALLKELQACRRAATPLARRVAGALGVDLAHVTGTGPHGRIKRMDVETAARDATDAAAKLTAAAKAPEISLPVAPAPIARASEAYQLAAPALIGPGRAPIVLLHGFGADRASWRPLAGLLDSNHPLVMLELPGHGQAAPRAIASVEDLAFAVAEQLREKGIETAHVVGHSLGGAVAITLADLGLIAPRSLGLIAPGGLGPEINTAFIRGLAGATRPEELQPWLEIMVADPAALPAGFANAVMRQRGNVAVALLALADALFGESTQTMRLGQRLMRFEMPVKVIWGRRDRVIPSTHAAELPGHIGLHLLSGVGHVPHLEAPALVARLINELVHAGE